MALVDAAKVALSLIGLIMFFGFIFGAETILFVPADYYWTALFVVLCLTSRTFLWVVAIIISLFLFMSMDLGETSSWWLFIIIPVNIWLMIRANKNTEIENYLTL